MDCTGVEFCQECYDALMRNEVDRLFLCNPAHRFLKMPFEGIKRHTQSDDGRFGSFLLNEKVVTVVDLVDDVEEKWAVGTYFQVWHCL
jgi:hypothetical protein